MTQFLSNVLRTTAILLISASVLADTVTVAVASNFADTAEKLAAAFESQTTHEVRLIRGSSGRLFSQIVNGAPIDIFLSADAERPRQLEARALAQKGSVFTYAIGELVVWSRDPKFESKNCMQGLQSPDIRKIAIANPLLAPYGAAAKEFLRHELLWEQLKSNLVIGENIAQAMQFTVTGNATIGLIAKSQIMGGRLPTPTCVSPVPANTHAPIRQDAAVTKRGVNNTAAIAFAKFLQRAEARELIRKCGYTLPDIDKRTL